MALVTNKKPNSLYSAYYQSSMTGYNSSETRFVKSSSIYNSINFHRFAKLIFICFTYSWNLFTEIIDIMNFKEMTILKHYLYLDCVIIFNYLKMCLMIDQ